MLQMRLCLFPGFISRNEPENRAIADMPKRRLRVGPG
jgi:hypothetical protein